MLAHFTRHVLAMATFHVSTSDNDVISSNKMPQVAVADADERYGPKRLLMEQLLAKSKSHYHLCACCDRELIDGQFSALFMGNPSGRRPHAVKICANCRALYFGHLGPIK